MPDQSPARKDGPQKPYVQQMKDRLQRGKQEAQAQQQQRQNHQQISRQLGGQTKKSPSDKKDKPKTAAKKKLIAFTRMPHGTEYRSVYDEPTKTWDCILIVPGHNPFVLRQSGHIRTIQDLDQLYRKAIAPPEPTEKKTDAQPGNHSATDVQ